MKRKITNGTASEIITEIQNAWGDALKRTKGITMKTASEMSQDKWKRILRILKRTKEGSKPVELNVSSWSCALCEATEECKECPLHRRRQGCGVSNGHFAKAINTDRGTIETQIKHVEKLIKAMGYIKKKNRKA